jgi:hypothetical protein
MKTKFIIQPKVFGDETNQLIEALEKNHVPYYVGIPESIDDDNFFVRGTINFVQSFPNTNKKFKINLQNYDYTTYSKRYKFLYNSNYIVLPWHRLEYSLSLICKCFINSEKYFIRPNSGKKIFTGTTLTPKWWDKELEIIKNLPSSSISDDDLVIISPYKKIIENEYRVLMCSKEILDFSIYNEINEKRIKIETIREFFELCDLPEGPDQYYTIDITGFDDPSSLEIIEINSFASAGWYGVDYEKVVKHIINID